MAAVQFTNFFATELVDPVAPTDTTIHVMSLTSDIIAHITGGSWMYLTLVDAASWNNRRIPFAVSEIVKVTAIAGSAPDYSLTVVRAADQNPPQTAQAFSRCDIAAFLLNAQSLYDIVGGGGSAVSITATLPATVTPSPITGTGVVGVNTMTGDSGSGGAKGAVPAPGAGDAAAGKFLKADATWAVPAGGGSVSITATTPIVVTPSPLTGTGVVSHAATAVTPSTYGDSTHVAQFTVNQTGHITAASNVALSTGGTLQSHEFTSSGTFNVPTGVTAVWLNMVGGGGGGSCTISAAAGGGGGGGGEQCTNLLVNCISAGTLTVTIGAAGTGGATGQVTAQAGGSGGDTSVANATNTWFARGGFGGTTTGAGGVGGGAGRGNGGPASSPGNSGSLGSAEASTFFGGSGGGGGSTTIGSNGGNGGPAGGYLTTNSAAGGTSASSQGGGGGGASTIYGIGGAGGNGGAVGNNASATSYGSGGGGAGGHATTTVAGGNGAPGYVLIIWVA